MRMQNKLTVTLLIVGLLSAGTVGGVAYMILMRGFEQAIMDQAYVNFSSDIQDYLEKYGSWENGSRQERFPDFVRQKRNVPRLPPMPPFRRPASEPFQTASDQRNSPPFPPLRGPAPEPSPPVIDRRNQPPFHFLVLDPSGIVLTGWEDYPTGSQAPPAVMKLTRPIKVRGEVRLLIAPLGEPILTPSDHGYLEAMRQALLIGITVAFILALLIGVITGNRISRTLRLLTSAIRSMRKDREAEHPVPITSDDELGELARAFNQMNSELSRAHRELRESSELVQKQADALRELSIKDPLTHLFNRRHFDEQAHKLYEQSRRYGHPMTVMVGDLDHFKQVNDRLSHAVGDEVLRQVAKLIGKGVRKSDVAARYGGEEFVILFPNSTLKQAAHCCEALRHNIESHPWHDIDPGLKVTISMGLSDDLTLNSVEKMIAQADERLYAAKHGGRNCIIPVIAAA